MKRFSRSLSLVLLASLARAGAQTIQDPPVGRPDAVIDLASREGVQLVNGQWHYHDVKILPAHRVRIDSPVGRRIQGDGDIIGCLPVEIVAADRPIELVVPA